MSSAISLSVQSSPPFFFGRITLALFEFCLFHKTGPIKSHLNFHSAMRLVGLFSSPEQNAPSFLNTSKKSKPTWRNKLASLGGGGRARQPRPVTPPPPPKEKKKKQTNKKKKNNKKKKEKKKRRQQWNPKKRKN